MTDFMNSTPDLVPNGPCDLFIKNALLVTMDEGLKIYHPGSLAVRGDTIAALGPQGGLEALERQAREVLDAGGKAVLPGLVNSHTHAAMTLFRGLADDLPLEEWLNRHIFPAERRINGEWVYWGTLLACAEMIASGTTTFCDMYLFEDEVARAASRAGVRALVGEVLYDFPSPNYGPLEQGFAYTRELIARYREDPLISVAVEPHTPFTCSPALLQTAKALSGETGVPLIIHLAETRGEAERIAAQYGRSPARHLDHLGLLDENLIAVHGVFLDEAELDLVAEKRTRVVHCPESNMKLASGVAPVVGMRQRGIPVGLGTDGCASNNNLDLFQEMDTAAKLHKVFHRDPTVLPAPEVVRLATIGGARVLGLDGQIGSLEVGKKADLIFLDLDQPHLTPLYNIYSHLVYCARGADVSRVIVGGRTLMAGGRFTTLDWEEVAQRARRFAGEMRDMGLN
jgi:5-methylthioadenosine/S-adenosylhomocysteine deaminase